MENTVYEQCEDCYRSVDIMKMVVKGTADGNCIYCPECVERHKHLETEAKKLIEQWGLDIKL